MRMARSKIERLESDLRPSIFDVDDNDAGFALQYVAAHLARQAVEIAFRDSPTKPEKLSDTLAEAKAYLEGPLGRMAAADNMALMENVPGVLPENADEVIARARHLLDCLLQGSSS